MTEVTLKLPDDLAQRAKEAGLLSDRAIQALLEDAMRRRRVDRLFATMDQLHRLEPHLNEEEIQAEIDAARAERRARNANRR